MNRERQDRRFRPHGKAPVSQRGQLSRLASECAIYGLHAAEAALSNPNRVILSAFLTENAAARLTPLLRDRNLEPNVVNAAELTLLLGGDAVHQGAVLSVEPLNQPSLETFLDATGDRAAATVVMLDQVTDPHNVGAVLRSAAAFGVAAAIVQARHSPPLSATLAKAASGALEHVPVIETVNLSRALALMRKNGFHCAGFDSDASETFGEHAVKDSRIVFVFGAEDKGLRRLVRENCDAVYALSAPGPIKSLNISNAAAIVFYEASKAMRR